MSGKQSFFAGVAVALQAVAGYQDSAIAHEIMIGLGHEKEEFYEYLRWSDTIDKHTLEWLLQERI